MEFQNFDAVYLHDFKPHVAELTLREAIFSKRIFSFIQSTFTFILFMFDQVLSQFEFHYYPDQNCLQQKHSSRRSFSSIRTISSAKLSSSTLSWDSPSVIGTTIFPSTKTSLISNYVFLEQL